MNMSYCRYENTLNDVRDCIQDAVSHINKVADSPVSASEIVAFRKMIKEFFAFLNFCEVIDYENQCLNDEKLDKCCFRMEK